MGVKNILVFSNTLVCLFFCFSTDIFSQEEESFKKGIILIGKEKSIKAEYTIHEDNYFLRDKEKAILIPKLEITGVVDEDYYQKIKNSSRTKSVMESFYLFSSGREYQWFGKEDSKKSTNTIFTEPNAVFLTKLALVLSTVYFYLSSLRANEEIQNSVFGLGSDSAIARFNREYNSYKIAGGLTILTFSASAIHTYIRFGTNSEYKDLEIHNRKLEGISLLKDSKNSNGQNISIGINLKF